MREPPSQKTMSRDPGISDQSGDRECDEQADVDVAVPVQTDEEDCHRVEGYADKQRATNGVAIGLRPRPR